MKDFKNILAINFGGIGDEIFFLPSLISLKKEFPNSKITLALESRSKCIKDLTDIIDNIITVDVKGKHKYFELLKLVLKAQFGKYNVVISSGGNKLIGILLFLTGIKERYGFDTGKLSQKLLTKAVKLDKNRYACTMYHELVSPLTSHYTELPQISIPPQDKIPNTILIHPGVSKMSIQKGMVKTIPAQLWSDVIKKLLSKGKKVILSGGPDDNEVINSILSDVSDADNFENYYGKTKNIRELAELIGKSEIFICSDSAPLHIGVAMGTKTYAIFGPTDDRQLIPRKDFVKAIKHKNNCSINPCLWAHRNTTCKSLECLEFTADEIINQIAELAD